MLACCSFSLPRGGDSDQGLSTSPPIHQISPIVNDHLLSGFIGLSLAPRSLGIRTRREITIVSPARRSPIMSGGARGAAIRALYRGRARRTCSPRLVLRHDLEDAVAILTRIPGFARPTVEGTPGTRVGKITVHVAAMQALSFYDLQFREVTFPVRTFGFWAQVAECDARAASTSPSIKVLYGLSDHLNLMGATLARAHDDDRGALPDMTEFYSGDYQKRVEERVDESGIAARIYQDCPGRATNVALRSRILRILGADAVGIAPPGIIIARRWG